MSTTDTRAKVEPVKAYSTGTGQAMGLGLILLAGLWATPIEFWQGPQSLHIGLEIIAALLAIVVALRYASEWVLVLLFFWSAWGYMDYTRSIDPRSMIGPPPPPSQIIEALHYEEVFCCLRCQTR